MSSGASAGGEPGGGATRGVVIRMAARMVTVAVGVWLMFAPAVLGYSTPAEHVDRIAGPIAAGLAFVALWEVLHTLRWATIPVGVFLVVAPMVFWYSSWAAVANSVACGLVIAGAGLVRGALAHRYGGGWLAVADPERARA